MSSSFRLIKALQRQAVDSTPVWLMRQAGRYLPEYREIRQKMGGFLGMCKTPDVATQITLQPLNRFDLDAAIIFSDILTIPDAMGLGLRFETGEGPQFAHPVRTMQDIEKLPIPDPEQDLGYVMQAIRLTSQALKDKAPLMGFCGSPWTVATYMVEGKSSRHFAIIKAMMYQEPQMLTVLLSKLTQASCHYLEAQIQAGASALMIFDTWGGVLTPQDYLQFSLHFMQEMVAYLKAKYPHIPVVLFTKGGGQWLEEIALTGCDAIGIDWTVDIGKAKKRVGAQVALQGNLDPAMLYASPETIKTQVKNILAQYGKGSGHVFNLGHGIYPDVQPESVQAMIEAVRRYSPQYHQ